MQLNQMFRKESLQRYCSPEELDRPFRTTSAWIWLPLTGLLVLGGLTVAWAYLGRIPQTVDGVGVLVNPGRVRPLQVSFGGQIVELCVREGQAVHPGDVIAVLNLPDQQQQLQQATTRLRELRRVDESQKALEKSRLEQEQKLRSAQEKVQQQTIRQIEQMVAQLEARSDAYHKVQREKLQQGRKETQELDEALKARLDSARKLAEKRLVSDEVVLQAESAWLDRSLQRANLDVRLIELDLKNVETQQQLLQQRTRVAELQIQLRQLDVRAVQVDQEIAQSQAARTNQLLEQETKIRELEGLIAQNGKVRSPAAGRILELPVHAGEVVMTGGRIGALELASTQSPGAAGGERSGTLTNLAYFPVRSGKRIEKGMLVRVTPTTVERERFGSIVGKVTRVAPFPVTEQALAAMVGNPEVVQGLTQKGGMIEVEVELEQADTVSGYRWTSAGPPIQLSAGTTTQVRITLEERRPITFLMPLLRSWFTATAPDEGASERGTTADR